MFVMVLLMVIFFLVATVTKIMMVVNLLIPTVVVLKTNLIIVVNSLSASPRVALNWAWASISPWISSRVCTMNMSTRSSLGEGSDKGREKETSKRISQDKIFLKTNQEEFGTLFHQASC